MVHSVASTQSRNASADELSRKLHWFRWEAAQPAECMALMIVVYYLGGALSIAMCRYQPGAAVGVGVAALISDG